MPRNPEQAISQRSHAGSLKKRREERDFFLHGQDDPFPELLPVELGSFFFPGY
jgi:hypothetical protein